MGRALVNQLPRRERGALIARARLVDIDMDGEALLHRHIDRRGRGAVVDRREPARIAVGEDVDRLARLLPRREIADDRDAVSAHGAVDRDILIGDLRGLGVSRRGALGGIERPETVARGVERPAQVDRGRPRRVEPLPGRIERCVARVLVHGERYSVGRRGADQRRAAHPHVADRVRRVADVAERFDAKLVRQPSLVDDVDAPSVRVQPNGAVRAPADLHAPSPHSFARRGTPAGGTLSGAGILRQSDTSNSVGSI